MKKENKMYSFEIVNKAVSAAAVGFSCGDRSLKESIKDLPEEVKAIVLASVLIGHATINARMHKIFSEASEIEKKLKEMKNPTKEDVDRLFKEAFEKMGEEK